MQMATSDGESWRGEFGGGEVVGEVCGGGAAEFDGECVGFVAEAEVEKFDAEEVGGEVA